MKLTALRANNPVAVMAAYGALRLLPGARLRWDGLSLRSWIGKGT
jgi:hypothetical protein